jgi:glutaredoxin
VTERNELSDGHEGTPSQRSATQPRIVLVTRPGCHLCDDAKEVLARIGEPWVERNVEDDIELEREYGERLPVVLLDGEEHGYWRVEEARLRRDLGR